MASERLLRLSCEQLTPIMSTGNSPPEITASYGGIWRSRMVHSGGQCDAADGHAYARLTADLLEQTALPVDVIAPEADPGDLLPPYSPSSSRVRSMIGILSGAGRIPCSMSKARVALRRTWGDGSDPDISCKGG